LESQDPESAEKRSPLLNLMLQEYKQLLHSFSAHQSEILKK
jgi:hypothetical protein